MSHKFLNPPTLPPPAGFSQIAAVPPGHQLFLISGQMSRDSKGELVGPGDFRAQVTQTFENLKLAAEAAGGSFANIVKLNYYCVASVPAGELAVVREVRDRFVDTQNPPASTFVFVSRLVREEWLIEIEALAVV
jgi:enamine deaminase RidA (YjgF/YER057c/UK114 family)